MKKTVITKDIRIIEKMKKIIPKLSPSSKNKLLTAVEKMAELHEANRTAV